MDANCRKSCKLCKGGPESAAQQYALPTFTGVSWEELKEAAIEEPPDANELKECNVKSLLSPQQMPGLHIICWLEKAASTGGARLAIWKDAASNDFNADVPPATQMVVVPEEKVLGTPSKLIRTLAAELGFTKKGGDWSSPALFTCGGDRLLSLAAIYAAAAEDNALCFYEGGQFIWPPGSVGSTREVDLPGGRVGVIKTLSLTPVVFEIENFLDAEETAHIREISMDHLRKSPVALKDVDIGKQAKEWRTSSQYFLPTSGDANLESLDQRVQALTRIPITHAEYIQVLRYNKLEHYSAHHDYFNPSEYASNKQMLADIKHGARNRMATVFFYLSDVTEGGETNFPRAGGLPQPYDFFDCSRGLSVKPADGKVIIFYSMHASADMDPYSLHAGCDVINGTKISANFWLWNQPYNFVSPQRKEAFSSFKNDFWRR